MADGGVSFALIAAAMVAATATVVASSQQARAAKFNANIADENARIALDEGRVEEDRRRRIARIALGSDRASVGASGILVEGSPLDLIEDNAAQLEINALQAKREAALRARGFNVDSSISRFEASAATTRGYMGAASQLVSGGAGAYSNYQTTTLLKQRANA